MAGRMTSGQAVLAALAGLTAYEAGMYGEAGAIGAEEPGQVFVGMAAVALRLAEEVRALGGDPGALRARIYDQAQALAAS
jgi:nicotinamide mononucleotide (NMN) deamidase PncC